MMILHSAVFSLACCLGLAASALAAEKPAFQRDVIPTSAGPVAITFYGHASLMLEFGGKVIQVDPWGQQARYAGQPKADLILVTHEHYDHLDPDAIKTLRKPECAVLINPAGAEQLAASKEAPAHAMKNGDALTTLGLRIEAVPAYNIIHMRAPGQPFHPRGVGNGYILTAGATRIYIAGDTENTPEMKALKNIDVAFLPMNLPYTMTPEQVADAARAFKPKVLYPYHFGETDTAKLAPLLKDQPGIEIRLRRMP